MPKAKTKSNRSVRRKKIRSVKRNKQKKQAVKSQKKRTNKKKRRSVNRKHKRNTMHNKIKKGGCKPGESGCDKAEKILGTEHTSVKFGHNPKTDEVINLIKEYNSSLFPKIELDLAADQLSLKTNLDLVFHFIEKHKDNNYKTIRPELFEFKGSETNGIIQTFGPKHSSNILQTDDLYKSLNKLFDEKHSSDDCDKDCKLTKHIPNYILHAFAKQYNKAEKNSYLNSNTFSKFKDINKENVIKFINGLNEISFGTNIAYSLKQTDSTNNADKERIQETKKTGNMPQSFF